MRPTPTARRRPFPSSSSFAAASRRLLAEVPDDDFTCNICFDSNVPLTERHWLRGGGGCAHAFCKGCVRGWLTVRVGEGEIHFSCPLAFVATSPEATTNGNGNSLGCTAMACEEDLVASGCSPETVAAYRRYQRQRGPGGDRLRDALLRRPRSRDGGTAACAARSVATSSAATISTPTRAGRASCMPGSAGSD